MSEIEKDINKDKDIVNNPKYDCLYIDLDTIDFEKVIIYKNGKQITFPTWEFWQILEKKDDE